MKVYLSGGMKSGWQKTVKMLCYNSSFIDPSAHGLSIPSQYTTWDLLGIKHCDVVFAYMESDNPSGFGLSLEVGYAAALGKTIIFVDEKRDERMKIVREASSVVCDTLKNGIEFLNSLETIS